jgi:16S rRNA processing protein RimM
MQRTTYFNVGYIKKPFGNEGYIAIDLNDEALDMIDDFAHFFIYLDGAYIPFFIETYDEKSEIIIKFEEVDNPEQAAKLSNHKIYITEDQFGGGNPNAFSIHTELENYAIYNNGALIGKVDNVEEYPSQLMMYFSYKGNIKLIPLAEDFIEKIDNKKKELYLSLPEGLLDL